ncbi:MAG: hypothetical protein IJW20_02940 [Clostridia bacterium]|nr:hypothetical protein [Clostridia bacterium]
MVYIKLENGISKDEEKLKFIKNRFYKFKYKFVKLKEEKIENGNLLILPNLEKYTYEKLSKYIKVKCITKVCISDELIENTEFVEFLNQEQVEFFDGKWLFKHMCIDIVKYVCNSKKGNLGYQEISLLSNDIDRVIKQIILDLAPEVRVLNLITQNENKFKKIEKELYNEQGIILNINNNYQKSLSRSDIILNFDFGEEELNKYNINSKSCIINFNDEINIKEKTFEGINVKFFDLILPRKYIRNSIYLNDFNNVIFYESLIYKKTSPENIKREIKNDKINISFLNGKNGRIRKNEYLKLSKKIAN